MTVAEEEIKQVSEIHPFLEHVEKIISEHPQFYTIPNLALLTYRYLSSLSQFVINRLLLFKGPVPFIEVRNWFKPEFKAVQNKLLWRLKQLQILQGRGQEVWINPTFQKSLLSESFAQHAKQTNGSHDSNLDSFARNRWEGVLYELVKDSASEPSSAASTKRVKREQSNLEHLLCEAGLLNNGKVTNSGFQFLLKDVSSQVWTLLLHYLNSKHNDPALLEFLASQILQGDSGTVASSSISSEYLHQLDEFGLLRVEDGRFKVTRLLTSLSGAQNALDFTDTAHASRSSTGFLVIESNYRVYAYTSSPLQIATLSLFISLQDRFPNMVYGQMTGESVQSALSHGITADQIIQYLQLNVHSCMLGKALDDGKVVPFNGIPFTVVDQIRLWEMDRKRLAIKSGYLYQQFLTEAEYSSALEEAKKIGSVLYAKPAARVLIISEEGHDHMKQFCRKK